MASKFIFLSQKIGGLTRKYPLYQNPLKLTTENLRTTAFSISSISTGSSKETKPNYKKKLKHLSTNIIRVGEGVSDENAKVKRLKASEIPKIGRSSQNEVIEDDIGSSSIDTATTSTIPSNTIYAFDEQDNLDAEFVTETPEEKGLFEDENMTSIKIKGGKKKKLNEKMLSLYEELRRKGRTQSFNASLAAYLSVCIHSGFTNSAYQTLNYYIKLQNRQLKITKNSKLLNILPYNEILKGLAYQGDYKKIKDVREHLKKSSLTPTFETFAYILTILGRERESNSNIKEIKSTLQWMEKEEINLNEMFGKTAFMGDSLKFCLRAVERIHPDIKTEIDVLNPTLENLLKVESFDNRLLNSLNESMFSNKVGSPAEGVLTSKELKPLIDKQVKNELKGFVSIPTIYSVEISNNFLVNRDLLEKWKVYWRKSLQKTVSMQKKFMNENFISKKSHAMDFYPYLHALDNEEIVNLLMLEISNLCLLTEGYSSSLSFMYNDLGKEFFNRFQIKYKKNTNCLVHMRKVYEKYCDWYIQRPEEDNSYIPRVQWNKISADEIMNVNLKDVPCEWPYIVKSSIGKLLYNIIFSSAVVWKHDESPRNASPAFYKVHRTSNLKLREELKPSPILAEVCRGRAQRSLIFPTGTLPMISPPVPWTDMDNGGYFASKSNFIRLLSHANQQKGMIKSRELRNLYPVMDSLNELGTIPWKINPAMLDILIEVFNKNGWEEMDVAPNPSQLPTPPKILAQMTSKEKLDIQKQKYKYNKKKMEMNSIWCDTLYKLSIASFYRNCIIWLPQNMDFRGRTYPIPPHLTHVSADIFRSILLFAQGKKLGKEGLSWLKLHVINLTAMKKKCSLQERLDFYEEVKDEIVDSAKYPLTGNKWWTKSDDPWQTLAACKELVAALESENPEEYVSHLPIHQDGSCNGLQHYAALGRDEAGADSVNLKSRKIPQDVYSRIADLIEIRRKKDAEDGVPIAQILEGFVQRKVIKQTVMTTVYGVTKYGAKLQILKQLNYMDEFPDQHRKEGSFYLMTKTFESLDSMFTSTKKIQNWLVKIAEGVSKGCMKNVEWITPLGFPVVQPYSKKIGETIRSGMVTSGSNDDTFLRPNVLKQKNGFPPNFIHSLDSSHMMLTSIFCQHAGISFVSVHDCFWTHACSVPTMNKICREQFVKLHSEPILEDLAKYTIEKYSSHMGYKSSFTVLGAEGKKIRSACLEDVLMNVPRKGEFNINEVLESVFFFS